MHLITQDILDYITTQLPADVLPNYDALLVRTANAKFGTDDATVAGNHIHVNENTVHIPLSYKLWQAHSPSRPMTYTQMRPIIVRLLDETTDVYTLAKEYRCTS